MTRAKAHGITGTKRYKCEQEKKEADGIGARIPDSNF
jgi:hypothetical protein